MNSLDAQAWRKYIKGRSLSPGELENDFLCKELHKTLGFALCRIEVAFCNLGIAILYAIGIKKQ